VLLNILVFWNVMLCQLVDGYHLPADMVQNPRRLESPVLDMFDIKIYNSVISVFLYTEAAADSGEGCGTVQKFSAR
jgi:hypothetical protein